MFERQVLLTPNNVAVVDDFNRKMTFDELNEACNVLADNLVLQGVGPDRPVGIYMERCIEYVISYIAILKAGINFWVSSKFQTTFTPFAIYCKKAV